MFDSWSSGKVDIESSPEPDFYDNEANPPPDLDDLDIDAEIEEGDWKPTPRAQDELKYSEAEVFEWFNEEMGPLREEKEHLEEDCARLREELNESDLSHDALQRELTTEILELTKEKETLEQVIALKDKELSHNPQMMDELRMEMENQMREVELEYAKTISDMKEALHSRAKELHESESTLQSTRESCFQLEKQLADRNLLAQQKRTLESKCSRFKKENGTLNAAVAEMSERVALILSTNEQLVQQNEEQASELDLLQRELDELKPKKKKKKTSSSGSLSTLPLLQQSEEPAIVFTVDLDEDEKSKEDTADADEDSKGGAVVLRRSRAMTDTDDSEEVARKRPGHVSSMSSTGTTHLRSSLTLEPVKSSAAATSRIVSRPSSVKAADGGLHFGKFASDGSGTATSVRCGGHGWRTPMGTSPMGPSPMATSPTTGSGIHFMPPIHAVTGDPYATLSTPYPYTMATMGGVAAVDEELHSKMDAMREELEEIRSMLETVVSQTHETVLRSKTKPIETTLTRIYTQIASLSRYMCSSAAAAKTGAGVHRSQLSYAASDVMLRMEERRSAATTRTSARSRVSESTEATETIRGDEDDSDSDSESESLSDAPKSEFGRRLSKTTRSPRRPQSVAGDMVAGVAGDGISPSIVSAASSSAIGLRTRYSMVGDRLVDSENVGLMDYLDLVQWWHWLSGDVTAIDINALDEFEAVAVASRSSLLGGRMPYRKPLASDGRRKRLETIGDDSDDDEELKSASQLALPQMDDEVSAASITRKATATLVIVSITLAAINQALKRSAHLRSR